MGALATSGNDNFLPSDGSDLIVGAMYAENGPPYETWRRLRNEAPLSKVAPPGFGPFWPVTKYADICAVGKDPDRFLSYPGIFKPPADQEVSREFGPGAMRTIIEMDPPEHREYRKVASPRFTPRSMTSLEPIVRESAKDIVDEMARRGGQCDFAMDVAVAHPLRVLSTILGLPRDMEPRLLELTNHLFAFDDAEIGLAMLEGETRQESIMRFGMELAAMFLPIIEDRRANPRDDLATVLANGRVGGELMGPMETLGYYLITFTAGHDTTKNALAGGMHALMHHPEQYRRLRSDASLVPSAVEEIVRWTSPVNYMKRTASRDTELRGQKIAEGDELILFYASGNRDEEVFEDPESFRIDRSPNHHVGFGHGEHFCLGAHLARRSQLALLEELTSRVARIEPDGPAEWINASFVVGLKHLPVRYEMA